MHIQSLSCVQVFATLWTVARQSPLSMGFSRQEYWSGLPIPPSGDLPDPGVKSDWQANSLPLSHQLRSVSQSISSVPQLCPTLCNPMDCSMQVFPVLHQCLLKLKLMSVAQPHVHWVGDAIQPSHPLPFPFSSCLLSFPTSGSFPVSQFFASDGQNIGASASASVFPTNIQDWFPLGLTGLISLHSKGLSRIFSDTTVQKHQFFCVQLSLWSSFHIYTGELDHTGKTRALTRQNFVSKVMSLLFNKLCRLVIAFLPRSKSLFISWLQSPSDVGAQGNKVCHCFLVSPPVCHRVLGPDAIIFIFWMLNLKQAFSLSSFSFIKWLFSFSSFSAIRVASSAYLRLLIFLPANFCFIQPGILYDVLHI